MSDEEIKNYQNPKTDIHTYVLDKYKSIGYDSTQNGSDKH